MSTPRDWWRIDYWLSRQPSREPNFGLDNCGRRSPDRTHDDTVVLMPRPPALLAFGVAYAMVRKLCTLNPAELCHTRIVGHQPGSRP